VAGRAHRHGETPRANRRNQLRRLAGRDDELRVLGVALHHSPERLLEVLADGLGVVQQNGLVPAGDRLVARRLLQDVVYHVAFRHAGVSAQEGGEPLVVFDLLFCSVEEVGDVQLHEVVVGVLVGGRRKCTDGGGLPDPRRAVDDEVQRLVDGRLEVVASVRLWQVADLGSELVGPQRRFHTPSWAVGGMKVALSAREANAEGDATPG